MATVVRSDLLENRTKGLVDMNIERRESAMLRMMNGRSVNYSIIMCLGGGRCLFPIDGDNDGKRVCPFCLFYDERREHTDGHAFKTAQNFVKGH